MKFYSSFPLTTTTLLLNRAINYGDGIFETILVNKKTLPLWLLHCQRINESLKKLNINSINHNLLKDKILSLINDNNTYIAKLVIYRDDNKRGYASSSTKCQFFIHVHKLDQTHVKKHIFLTVSSIKLARQKQLAGIKHLNRLEQVLAANQLIGLEYDDAIMLDKKNNVIETTCKNIIFIKENTIFTPRLNYCGVYGVALRWLASQGYQLNWKKIEFKTIGKYDAVMICNSIRGFEVVTNIDNKYKFLHKLTLIDDIQNKWQSSINP